MHGQVHRGGGRGRAEGIDRSGGESQRGSGRHGASEIHGASGHGHVARDAATGSDAERGSRIQIAKGSAREGAVHLQRARADCRGASIAQLPAEGQGAVSRLGQNAACARDAAIILPGHGVAHGQGGGPEGDGTAGRAVEGADRATDAVHVIGGARPGEVERGGRGNTAAAAQTQRAASDRSGAGVGARPGQGHYPTALLRQPAADATKWAAVAKARGVADRQGGAAQGSAATDEPPSGDGRNRLVEAIEIQRRAKVIAQGHQAGGREHPGSTHPEHAVGDSGQPFVGPSTAQTKRAFTPLCERAIAADVPGVNHVGSCGIVKDQRAVVDDAACHRAVFSDDPSAQLERARRDRGDSRMSVGSLENQRASTRLGHSTGCGSRIKVPNHRTHRQ